MVEDPISITNDILTIDNIKEHILPHYSLQNGQVTIIKFKDTDKQRAVYRIDYQSKSYCLKKVYYDEPNLLFVYSAMEWLYRNDINVPKLLPTTDRSRYYNYNGVLFILTPWIYGEKCTFDNIEHLELSSKTLAKVHKVSTKFTPIEGSQERVGLDDFHLSISKHFNQLLQSANYANNYKDKFSKIFLDNLDYNLELAKLSLEITSSINSDNLSRSLCHGDYVNKNIIINEEKEVWIIDFDKCKYDHSAHDLAYFLRRLLKRPTTNWDTKLTLQIIDNYRTENILSHDDLKYILAYVAFPQKFWKISRDYYKNIKKCNKNSFVTILDKSLERAEDQLTYVNDMIKILEKDYGVKF